MEKNPSLADVAARRQEIEKEIEARKAELADLAFAERVLRRLAGTSHPTPPIPPRPPASHPSPAKVEGYSVDPAKESVESLISIVLSTSPRVWWNANELQRELSRLKGAQVPMSTISPTLSNMKSREKIVRDGMRVADPNRVAFSNSALDLQMAGPEPKETGSPEGDPGTGEPDRSPIETQSRSGVFE
jgi:hypothetical protein